MNKTDYRCPECGSRRITFAADVEWDFETQDWAVGHVGEPHCMDCDFEGASEDCEVEVDACGDLVGEDDVVATYDCGDGMCGAEDCSRCHPENRVAPGGEPDCDDYNDYLGDLRG